MISIQRHIVTLKKYPKQSMPGLKTKKELDTASQDAIKKANAQTAEDASKLLGIYKSLDAEILRLANSNAQLANGIGKVMKTHQELAGQFTELSKDINVLAQRNADLQKQYGMNIEAAGAFGYELDKQAVRLGTSRKNIENNYKALKALTGGTRPATDALMKLNQYYSVNRGLSQDATDGLLSFAAAQTEAGSDAEITKQVERQRQLYKYIEQTTGIKGAQLDIEEAIGSAAAGTRLTFKKYPAQLALSVMKLKAMGMELADLEAIGDNLLNIESSVGEELNYQLLTGRRLVGEKGKNEGKSLTNLYREQYLRGKSNDAADTLNQIIMQEGDILENNMLARKQMAKTLGIEESKLNSIVERRKLLKQLETDKGIKIDLNLTGKALEETLKKQGVAAEDISKIMTADDARSPEARTADSIANIEANGIMLRMTKEGKPGEYNANIIADAWNETETSLKKFGAIMDTQFQTYTKDILKTIGQVQISRVSYDADGIMKSLIDLEKAQGGIGAVAAEALKNALDKVLKGTIAESVLKGGKLESMSVTSETVTVAGGIEQNDAVMVNDGFVSFNPRDKFRRINDGMTVAGTNVGGLDRYASQMEKRDKNFQQSMTALFSTFVRDIKTAIETANLKVNIDRTFTGTTLNPVGRYERRT